LLDAPGVNGHKRNNKHHDYSDGHDHDLINSRSCGAYI
jgi:hypothetical protein